MINELPVRIVRATLLPAPNQWEAALRSLDTVPGSRPNPDMHSTRAIRLPRMQDHRNPFGRRRRLEQKAKGGKSDIHPTASLSTTAQANPSAERNVAASAGKRFRSNSACKALTRPGWESSNASRQHGQAGREMPVLSTVTVRDNSQSGLQLSKTRADLPRPTQRVT